MVMMRRDGFYSGSRASSSLFNNVFPLWSLRSITSMLFVDLLTGPGHQGEALREPRLHHHLRISIILLLRQHGPDATCHPVGQRDRDQHSRFTLQYFRQTTALANSKPCHRRDHRHRPGDQQTSNIVLAYLRRVGFNHRQHLFDAL